MWNLIILKYFKGRLKNFIELVGFNFVVCFSELEEDEVIIVVGKEFLV